MEVGEIPTALRESTNSKALHYLASAYIQPYSSPTFPLHSTQTNTPAGLPVVPSHFWASHTWNPLLAAPTPPALLIQLIATNQLLTLRSLCLS